MYTFDSHENVEIITTLMMFIAGRVWVKALTYLFFVSRFVFYRTYQNTLPGGIRMIHDR